MKRYTSAFSLDESEIGAFYRVDEANAEIARLKAENERLCEKARAVVDSGALEKADATYDHWCLLMDDIDALREELEKHD